MHERLIELWLDSASERAYQPAFVQMLVGQGYQILHSTRHGPLEFGKDVLAVSPDGIPCAFQLKGNPGGRLNRTQFRDVQPQLQELVATAITYQGAPDVQHRSYLVTNGFVEEDVMLLVAQMNQAWRRQGYGEEALQVLTRGNLLAMAQEAGTELWPFSLKGMEGVIGLLGHRGDSHLPLPQFHALLADIYALDEASGALGTAELERRLPVAALLISISLRNFAGSSNHFAVLSAWVIYFAYTVAALERHDADRRGEASLEAARAAAYAAMGALNAEAMERVTFVEGDTWTDTEFVPVRTVLVNALLSVRWLWSQAAGDGLAEAEDPAAKLDVELATAGLWGEASVPQLLAHHWYLAARGRLADPTQRIGSLLTHVVAAQSGLGGLLPLAPPYYGAGDVVLHRNHAVLPGARDPLENEFYAGQSFSALGVLHLVAQAGAKAAAEAIWAPLTRLTHHAFHPATPWQFCLVRSPSGQTAEVILRPRGSWSEIVRDASDPALPGVPRRLADDPLMLLLFIIVCPHRMTPEVLRYLGLKLGTAHPAPQSETNS